MPQNQVVAAAFAYSVTPYPVMSCNHTILIVAANNALFTWLGYIREELLNMVFFKAATRLSVSLNLSEHQLSHLFKQVVATKAFVKGSIKSADTLKKIYAKPVSCFC